MKPVIFFCFALICLGMVLSAPAPAPIPVGTLIIPTLGLTTATGLSAGALGQVAGAGLLAKGALLAVAAQN